MIEKAFCINLKHRTDRWNDVENETTLRSGELELKDYLKVYPDLVAALNYVEGQDFTGDIIVWRSSFSSTLVLKLAGEYSGDIEALLSFSPGEYSLEVF